MRYRPTFLIALIRRCWRPVLAGRYPMLRSLCVALGLLCASCASQEPWTFGLSRSVYENFDAYEPGCEPQPPEAAIAMVALLVLPLALDLLALPVALPRDWVVLGSP